MEFERAGCADLAREQLCGSCASRARGGWPGRFARLRGARLVLATQQQVAVNPAFVPGLRTATGAGRVLTLVDEAELLTAPFARTVDREHLTQLAAVLDDPDANLAAEFPGTAAWSAAAHNVLAADANALGAWGEILPRPPREWLVAVQSLGRAKFGDAWRYPGHDLQQLVSSPAATRGLDDEWVRFAALPDLGDEFGVLTNAILTGLVEHRLSPPGGAPARVLAPFAAHRFEHPETQWYNLNDRSAAARYFAGNARRVMEFFARLIARNVTAGRRTLLVARKKLRGICARELARALGNLGVPGARVVTGNWDAHDLSDPLVLPLITYGTRGVNRFEDHDAAYCVTGFLVPPAAVEELLNDLLPPGQHREVTLGFAGRPARRTIEVSGPHDPALTDLAAAALVQREAEVVVQAVGRVRPFTRPREVITFQAGELPGVRFDREFASLFEARAYSRVPTARAATVLARAATARRMCDAGASWAAIGAALGVSRATVARHLASTRVEVSPPLSIVGEVS